MRVIIYIVLMLLFMNELHAQSYSTSYTKVRSLEGEEVFEEKTMFLYTDSTLTILSPQIMQKFSLNGAISHTVFSLKDVEGKCADIEYHISKQKRFLRKPEVNKFIILTYDKEYSFYFKKP